MISGEIPASSRLARMATAPRCGALNEERAPWKEAMGVLLGAQMSDLILKFGLSQNRGAFRRGRGPFDGAHLPAAKEQAFRIGGFRPERCGPCAGQAARCERLS